MALKYQWRVLLQSTDGFSLDFSSLDVGQGLGFLNTILEDPRVKIRSVGYSGGRNRELDALPPGTASIVFDNRDGLFNPNNATSPYYGLIFPGKQIVLQWISFDGSGRQYGFSVFSGQTVSWTFDFDLSGDAIATVTAKDTLGLLAGVLIPPTVAPEESSGSRFGRICALAGLNAAQFSFEAGSSVFASQTLEGDALQLVQDIVFQEQGYVTVLGSGVISFVGRNWFQDPRSTSIVFSDNETVSPVTGGFAAPYGALTMVYSDDSLTNSVTTTSALGTAVSTNSASVTQYGKVSKAYDTSYSTFLEQQNFGAYISGTYGEPEFRPIEMTVSLDSLFAAGVGYAFADLHQYGTIASVLFTPPGGGGVIDSAYVVSSWAHSSTPASYTLTVGFEPLTFQNVFRLDWYDYGAGELDTGVLAF